MSGFLPEIFGHEEVKERLQLLLMGGRVPNGILLAGEEGRGKFNLALSFARAILIGDAEGHVRPGSPAAKKIDAGTYADLEIVAPEEGRRLLGIDRIRSLKESFSLTPLEGDQKIAVVRGADRLTEEAANALLKLLEEPPPGAHLLLTARSREAVKETLVSRCLVIHVAPLRTDQVRELLESRGIESERAGILAALAEGRPGIALSQAEEDLDTTVLIPAAQAVLERGAPGERAAAVTGFLK